MTRDKEDSLHYAGLWIVRKRVAMMMLIGSDDTGRESC